MLESFEEEYKAVLPNGPRIPDRSIEPDKYRDKIKNSVYATLKNENKEGKTYSESQHVLMVWYNTLFLGRSKPSTHINALINITDDTLKKSIPEPLAKIIKKIKEIL